MAKVRIVGAGRKQPLISEKDLRDQLMPVLAKWQRDVNQTLSQGIYKKFHRRTGRLGQMRLQTTAVTAEGGGTQVHMELDGGPEYAGVQEGHRQEKARKKSTGMYMVPVYGKFGTEPVNHSDMSAELNTGNVVLLPGEKRASGPNSRWVPQNQWKNWLTDRYGRKVKYFVRLPNRPPSSGLVKKNRNRLGAASTGKQVGELLFIGYKDVIPGIPGRSRRFAKTARTGRSPLAAKYGFSTRQDDGGVATEHIASKLPQLVKDMWNPERMEIFADRMLTAVLGVAGAGT